MLAGAALAAALIAVGNNDGDDAAASCGRLSICPRYMHT